MSRPPRILIIGGGIAGLLLATKLGKKLGRTGRASVTVIDRDLGHVWKPMLHTFAAGTQEVRQQQVSYLAHAREHGYAFELGELCGLDRTRRVVQLAEVRAEDGRVMLEGREVAYDFLVLAIGSNANDFGTPGVRDHCHFIESQGQAEVFNNAFREQAMRSIATDGDIRVSIVGGGATGVELAAELSQLLEVAASYGNVSVRDRLSLTLIESGPRVLAAFPPEISESSESRLKAMGFCVLTNTKVTAAEPEGFRTQDGTLIPSDLMVWAAGVKAPDFLSRVSELTTNRLNQIVVRTSMQSVDDERIFALGDCASLTLKDNQRALAPTAQVATQQAYHLGKYLPAWLAGDPIPDFKYRDYGSLVSLSDYDAFGTLGHYGFFRGEIIRGRIAHLGHVFLYRRHQYALHGVRKCVILWAAERLTRLVKPKIRLT